MNTVKVILKATVKYNKKEYFAGEVLELPESEVKDLVRLDFVTVYSGTPPTANTEESSESSEKSSDDSNNIKDDSDTPDNLCEIDGIGESTEKALNDIGITTFAELADEENKSSVIAVRGISKKNYKDIVHQAEELGEEEEEE